MPSTEVLLALALARCYLLGYDVQTNTSPGFLSLRDQFLSAFNRNNNKCEMINRNVMCNCAKLLFAQDKELKLMTTMLKLWIYRSRNN